MLPGEAAEHWGTDDPVIIAERDLAASTEEALLKDDYPGSALPASLV